MMVASIGVYIGVSLFSPIPNPNTPIVGTTPAENTAASGLMSVVLLVVVAAIILMLVYAVGRGGGGGGRERQILRLFGIGGTFPNSWFARNYYHKRALSVSGEDLLAEVGVNMEETDELKDNSVLDVEPLELDRRSWTLRVDTNFEWLPMEKHGKYVMYKIVGLHRKQRGLNCVYLIGQDSHTHQPYLLRCPPEYMKASIAECIAWNIGVGKGDSLIEV